MEHGPNSCNSSNAYEATNFNARYNCEKTALLRTSCTSHNSGRKFLGCSNYLVSPNLTQFQWTNGNNNYLNFFKNIMLMHAGILNRWNLKHAKKAWKLKNICMIKCKKYRQEWIICSNKMNSYKEHMKEWMLQELLLYFKMTNWWPNMKNSKL